MKAAVLTLSLIVTFGLTNTSHASGSCYSSLRTEGGKTHVLLTNNALIGGEPQSSDCLEVFLSNTSGVTIHGQKVPVVLQLEEDLPSLLDVVNRIVGLTVGVKIEITSAHGSGTLKAFSR